MGWVVEGTDEFDEWYLALEQPEQEDILRAVTALEELGPTLGRPLVDTLNGSRFPNMKELRVQSNGKPIRVFFAFDPRRTGVLLIGGDKTGDKRFYDRMIPIADQLYAQHLKELEDQHGD